MIFFFFCSVCKFKWGLVCFAERKKRCQSFDEEIENRCLVKKVSQQNLRFLRGIGWLIFNCVTFVALPRGQITSNPNNKITVERGLAVMSIKHYILYLLLEKWTRYLGFPVKEAVKEKKNKEKVLKQNNISVINKMQIILAFMVLSLQYVSAFPSVEAEIAGKKISQIDPNEKRLRPDFLSSSKISLIYFN